MRRWIAILAALMLAAVAAPALAAPPLVASRGAAPPPTAPPPKTIFNDWAAIVVAGDWRAHSGGPTEAFDNARRDVAATLTRMGFQPGNITQFSTRPDRYPDTRPQRTHPRAMYDSLRASAERAPAGCLFYYTSHGAPQGAAIDIEGQLQVIPPDLLAAIVNRACPGRPTIVVVSTCFSGVNLPALENAQRLILTAARRDRTSFGCSEDDKYPFFDDCFLQSAETSGSLAVMPAAIVGCVSRREGAMGLQPASEPQIWVGSGLRPMLPLMTFPKGAPVTGTH